MCEQMLGEKRRSFASTVREYFTEIGNAVSFSANGFFSNPLRVAHLGIAARANEGPRVDSFHPSRPPRGCSHFGRVCTYGLKTLCIGN